MFTLEILWYPLDDFHLVVIELSAGKKNVFPFVFVCGPKVNEIEMVKGKICDGFRPCSFSSFG